MVYQMVKSSRSALPLITATCRWEITGERSSPSPCRRSTAGTLYEVSGWFLPPQDRRVRAEVAKQRALGFRHEVFEEITARISRLSHLCDLTASATVGLPRISSSNSGELTELADIGSRQ